jgi:hypothetical protein
MIPFGYCLRPGCWFLGKDHMAERIGGRWVLFKWSWRSVGWRRISSFRTLSEARARAFRSEGP